MSKTRTPLITGSTSGIGLGLAGDAAASITGAILPVDGDGRRSRV